MQPTNTITGVWRQGTEPKVQSLAGTAFMEEAGAHTFHVTGEDATGAAVAFTGDVTAIFLRADDTYIALDGSLSDGAAEVTLVSDCYHVPGRFSIAVYVSDGTVSTCVYAAVGNVYRTTSDAGLDSGASIPTLAQLEAAYRACVQATEDAEAAASQITNTVSYAAQTPTAAQSQTARINILAEEMQATPVRASDLTAGKIVYASSSATTIEMENGAPKYTDSANGYVWVATCAEGDKFSIYGVTAATNAKLCLFVDASGNILAMYGTSSSPRVDEVVTAPANSAFVIFHKWKTGTPAQNSISIGTTAKHHFDELDEAVAAVAEDSEKGVKYTAQTLTDAQQTQARHNVNAPSEPGVVGGDQHLAITATMENAWLSGGAVVYNANYLMSQIVDINRYMLLILDSGYSAGALYYASGVTNRASYSSTSGFKTGWLVLKPGERVSVVLRKNSDNTPIPLSDLTHMRIYDGYGKPSYTNTSPIGSLTSFAQITTVGTYFLSYNIDITNTNKSDLPTEYTSGNNAILDIKEYFYGGNRFLIQTLYTLTTPIKQWVRYSTNAGSAWNAWTRVMDRQEVMSAINQSVLAGKKVSIYGDSISTFSGYNPSGNAVWYTGSNCGVTSVDDTWWEKTIDALGLTLLVNNSWSGRFACGYADTWTGRTTNAGYKQTNIDQLQLNGEKPDIIIIELGINDFNNEAPEGDYDGTTTLPTDPNTFTAGYAMMLDRIMTTYPLAQVYCCTLVNQDHNPPSVFPEVNGNGVSLTEWNNCIRKLATAFGAKIIDFASCGITHYNMSTYIGDYGDYGAGDGVHPNAAGHSLMANEAIRDMDETVKTRY